MQGEKRSDGQVKEKELPPACAVEPQLLVLALCDLRQVTLPFWASVCPWYKRGYNFCCFALHGRSADLTPGKVLWTKEFRVLSQQAERWLLSPGQLDGLSALRFKHDLDEKAGRLSSQHHRIWELAGILETILFQPPHFSWVRWSKESWFPPRSPCTEPGFRVPFSLCPTRQS